MILYSLYIFVSSFLGIHEGDSRGILNSGDELYFPTPTRLIMRSFDVM